MGTMLKNSYLKKQVRHLKKACKTVRERSEELLQLLPLDNADYYIVKLLDFVNPFKDMLSDVKYSSLDIMECYTAWLDNKSIHKDRLDTYGFQWLEDGTLYVYISFKKKDKVFCFCISDDKFHLSDWKYLSFPTYEEFDELISEFLKKRGKK